MSTTTKIRLTLARLVQHRRNRTTKPRFDLAIERLRNALDRAHGSHFPMHPFERAGLGLAPFRLVDVVTRRGPLVIGFEGGVTYTVGGPGQPMGCCSYCFTGIAECFVIRSADGRLFDVGCDCVSRTPDRELVREVKREIGKLRKARTEERVEAARAKIESSVELRELLASKPSPNERRAAALGESALDWSEWMLAHSGAAGRLKVAQLVERVEKGGAP